MAYIHLNPIGQARWHIAHSLSFDNYLLIFNEVCYHYRQSIKAGANLLCDLYMRV